MPQLFAILDDRDLILAISSTRPTPHQLELRRKQFALLMHAAHDLQQTLEDADGDTGPVPQEPTTPETGGSIAAAMDTAGDDNEGRPGRVRGEAPPSA